MIERWKIAIERLGHCGESITCTVEEWHGGLRDELQRQAGKWVDQRQDIRAELALDEVRRLDTLFKKQP